MRIMLPLAAVAFAASALVTVPPAAATQATGDSCAAVTPAQTFDIDTYVAARKAAMSQQRVTHP